MRKTKKLLSAALAGVMALSMTACGGTESNGSSASGSNSGEAGSYTVGICQLQQHPALDAATKGFRDKLDALVQADARSRLKSRTLPVIRQTARRSSTVLFRAA